MDNPSAASAAALAQQTLAIYRFQQLMDNPKNAACQEVSLFSERP
jgi:hypothetical protein